MRIAVAIATTGRPQTIADCVRRLARQTRAPDAVHVCGAAPEDVASVAGVPGVQVRQAPKGLTRQRNGLLDAVGDSADVILFMDDDFVLHDAYLERLEVLFSADPGLVATNGAPIADGINTATGYTFEEADAMLASTAVPDLAAGQRQAIGGVYGCNFAVRAAAVRAHGLRFDERLPLYGWQEDIDFTAQLSRHGTVLRCWALGGVHLGVKGGRVSGVRFGYSQVANTVYLANKGTMAWPYALKLMSKNIAANMWGAAAANRVVDRRGRLKGNLMALQDVLIRQKVWPERILEL
jgi:glycosyltransferase involved in cell wall biosynthesis